MLDNPVSLGHANRFLAAQPYGNVGRQHKLVLACSSMSSQACRETSQKQESTSEVT